MLVLSRRPNEWLRVKTPAGEVIWLCVVEVKGGRQGARLGVDCEPGVQVVREELLPEEERRQRAQ